MGNGRTKKKSPAKICSSSAPPWIELPKDVTANILERLGAIEILESAQKVCTTWRKVCQDPSMWRFIDMRNGDCSHLYRDLDIMCRHAVDRSQGQLLGIHLEYFGEDETLQYIAQRSTNLKSLSFACCHHITPSVLIEAVKNLPQLEELRLIIMSFCDEDIEELGASCPKLKSFTLNERGTTSEFPYPDALEEDLNESSLAIAKSMPNLRHLQLFGNYMTNEGLQAILDGCPHLESLDLRHCKRIDLSGDLGKRCIEQIKEVRLPSDSVDDYEWDTGTENRVLHPHSPEYAIMQAFPEDDSDEDLWHWYTDYINTR